MRIILIRGLGRDQLHWQPLLREIRKVFPHALIETPDIPGTGVLHHVTSPLGLADYLPYFESQLSDSDEPAVVVGLSLGGMLALTWAALMPDRFSHVVVINTSSNLTPFYRRLKVYKAWKHPGAIFRFSIRAKERAVYHLTCNKRPMSEALLRDWEAIQRKHPVKITNQIRQIWAGLQFSPPPKDLLPPLSVVYSKADDFVDPRCSVDLINHYNSVCYVNDWAGHDLPQDDPQWLVQQLRRIVSGQTSLSH